MTETCTCQAWPPEGPSPDCAVHGAIRALNEANVELAALRAQLADARRAALNEAADHFEATKPSSARFWDVHDWKRVQIIHEHVKWLRERAKGGGDDT